MKIIIELKVVNRNYPNQNIKRKKSEDEKNPCNTAQQSRAQEQYQRIEYTNVHVIGIPGERERMDRTNTRRHRDESFP